MFRPMKFELKATANGVWLDRCVVGAANHLTWKSERNLKRQMVHILSITFLFHLSSHSIRHSTYVERHLRRLRLSFSPFVILHQDVINSVCHSKFVSIPCRNSRKWRKWKTWAPRELLVPNPHNQMTEKIIIIYMYRNEDGENNVLLWDVERPLRTPCAIFFSDSISSFLFDGIFPACKTPATWMKTNRNMMRGAFHREFGIKRKDTAALQRNHLTFHFYYLCLAFRFVFFFVFFLPFWSRSGLGLSFYWISNIYLAVTGLRTYSPTPLVYSTYKQIPIEHVHRGKDLRGVFEFSFLPDAVFSFSLHWQWQFSVATWKTGHRTEEHLCNIYATHTGLSIASESERKDAI